MRIGTRRSALALAQAEFVRELLGGEPEIVGLTSSGDRDPRAGDKSRWVGELERALSAGEIDLAVHSAKDLPGEHSDGLVLLGSPARAAPEDVLCGAASLDELPTGARVGTSSIRRAAQLRAARPDVQVVPLNGNVDTRLRKLRDSGGELQAIVLASAGLERLGLGPAMLCVLDPARFVPAPGQGALALQGRAGDGAVGETVAAITDERAFACLLAERALAGELGATCNTPLGALARAGDDGALTLSAWVGLPDGSAWASDEQQGLLADPAALGVRVAERLKAAGAGELLRRAEQAAGAEAGGAR